MAGGSWITPTLPQRRWTLHGCLVVNGQQVTNGDERLTDDG